jgi:hypothetical protein
MNKPVLQTETTLGGIAVAQYHEKIALNGVPVVE